QVAGDLGHRRVAVRARAAFRREVRRDRRERVEELRRRDTLVVDALVVDAELVAVGGANVGEVVDELRDVLLEIEPFIALTRAASRAAEAGDAGNRDGRTGTGVAVAHRALVAMRV